MFVPVTKGGELIKQLKKREEEVNKFSKERIKFVENGGVKLGDFLINKNPFPTLKCKKLICLICTSNAGTNPTIPCNTNNVGYNLSCKTCKARGKERVYEGETGRSARVRGTEHLRDFKNRKEKSPLFRHKVLEHPTEDIEIKMEITKPFKDALTRQSNEAVRIQNREKRQLLNSKSEFNHPPTSRIIVERNKKLIG